MRHDLPRSLCVPRWIAGIVLMLVLLVNGAIARAGSLITGSGASAGGAAASLPRVKEFDGPSLGVLRDFLPYGDATSNGVRVAVGDVNNDGIKDFITGLGDTAGAGPHVKVFSGTNLSELRSFFAYPGFTGGVSVAAGDVNGDGFADIITGADAGGLSHVKVFSGATGGELASFFAYPGFNGGVRVAAGDVNGDGKADIITGADSASPHVKVFDGTNLGLLQSFFAYAGFTGGVTVAAGDVNGDGKADIITGAGANGNAHVKVFNGVNLSELFSFLAYTGTTAEVRVAAGDVNNDGINDLLTSLGPGAPPQVKAFHGRTGAEIRSFFAYDPTFTGGVYVAGVAVPEPSTLALATLGILGVAGLTARRRRASRL